MGKTTRKPTSGVEDGGNLRFLGVKDGKLHFLDLSGVPELDLKGIPELDLTGIPSVDDLLKEPPCRKRRRVV